VNLNEDLNVQSFDYRRILRTQNHKRHHFVITKLFIGCYAVPHKGVVNVQLYAAVYFKFLVPCAEKNGIHRRQTTNHLSPGAASVAHYCQSPVIGDGKTFHGIRPVHDIVFMKMLAAIAAFIILSSAILLR
jgi:hypothetical protein